MKLETLQLSKLNPAEYNPRTITKDEFEGLKTSLKTFGQQENLIVNKDMTIISGHQRYNAMKALGWTEAVCNLVDLDKHEEKKLNVIMNSTAISGKYDDLMLSEILEELKLDDDYESLRLNELEPLDLSPTEVEEDEAPEVSQEPPVSKLGEIYQLGRHRVMCGDSTDQASVELLMNGAKADMVFTDPPYGIEYERHIPNKKHSQEMIKNDDTYSGWLVNVPKNIPAYICTRWDVYPLIYSELLEVGHIKNVIVWDKKSHGMGDLTTVYAPSHEFIVYIADKSEKLYGSRDRDLWTATRDSGLHPTMKPIEIIAKAIQNHTSDTVLDLFLGSGSTLIACEQTDRTCYGMELDPKYVDVIRKRYWKFINNGNEEGWKDGTTN